MHFPIEGTRKTLLFFTVLISWTIGLGKHAGDKTINLKIGFDLTQGTNGAPALRIRDFEDSDKSAEIHQRAEDDEKQEDKVSPAIRADSFSDEDAKGKQEASSRENDAKSDDNVSDRDEDDDDDGNDSGKARYKSTRGMRPGDYEPEENARIHDREDDDDDEADAEARRHRIKREVDYGAIKRKSKKFLSARKQGVSIVP